MSTTYKEHAAAALFPLLEGAELETIVQSMRTHGYDKRKPIILYDGKILDGRNRYRSAKLAGVEPNFIEVSVDVNPWLEAWKHNGARRDIEADRKTAIFLKLLDFSEEWQRAQDDRRRKANEARSLTKRGLPPVSDGSRDPRHGGSSLHATAEIAKQAGVSTGTVKRVQRLRKKSEKKFEAVVRGEARANQVLSDMKRNERMDKLANISRGNKPLEAPTRFPILYADPPWQYEHTKTESRAIENQYPTLSLRAICDLPVAKLCAPDCVLFLWVTSPKLEEAFAVLKAWGFTYRTSMVWVKDRIGMGYYARQKHELLLIATRGNPPTPEPKARPESVIKAKRGRHSEKPEIFYGVIEKMYPKLPKAELFSRSARKNWFAWGNEAS
jgi:N6-adenosine-specific RNA methylase IME4/ParB-like chromosome segregation protein Spo0J